ncbi:tripartite tricarboxylate transporter TctB family protein [Aureimonas frigidaquae]|uniref:Putative membrane protein n=1 Tax=Aureimonas frigidaquae TaxID=424757 RepID=A0A0P0Z1L0_9HYPH|nr:tripartite tricarboxylate transporter TctB family protein [Aureimonas frigidaquae]BAT27842.1 putative membrane protein [Aureimonas frigidaquae]
MANKDFADVCSGVVVCLFGVAVALYAYANYNLGTLQRMGPGMFPFAMGGVVFILGAFLCVDAFLREAVPLPDVNWRAAAAILAGMLVFSFTIQSLGLIPAIVAIVFLSALAESPFRPVRTILLSAALCFIAIALFRWGLGMSFNLYRWPFR